MCVFGPAFKARTRLNFLHSKWGHFDKARSKFQSSLCDYVHCFHNMGVGGYGRNPLFVRARHVQRCVKKCPHFECVIHRFVLALNAWTNTLYTCVYCVLALNAGTGRGVCVCVRSFVRLFVWFFIGLLKISPGNYHVMPTMMIIRALSP